MRNPKNCEYLKKSAEEEDEFKLTYVNIIFFSIWILYLRSQKKTNTKGGKICSKRFVIWKQIFGLPMNIMYFTSRDKSCVKHADDTANTLSAGIKSG